MVADDKINKRKSSTIRLEWCCVMPLVLLRQKLPNCRSSWGVVLRYRDLPESFGSGARGALERWRTSTL